MRIRHFATVFVTIAALLIQACDRRTVLQNINTALVIALAAAQVSGEVPIEYRKYVDAALAGIACQSQEAGTNDTAAIKWTKMTACLTAAAHPVMPPGTPQDLIDKAHNIAVALQRIISGLPAPTPQGAVRTQADAQPKPDVPTAEEKKQADDMKKRAEDGLKAWRSRV